MSPTVDILSIDILLESMFYMFVVLLIGAVIITFM